MWNLSRDAVRHIFEREPDVLVIGTDGSRTKRGYHTLRIPESVAERVHRRMCNPGLTTGSGGRKFGASRDHQLLSTTDGP